MARVREFLAGLGHDELSTTAQTVLGIIVVFVPFGSLVLLTRWAPVRRLLRKLAPGPHHAEAEVQVVVVPEHAGNAIEPEVHEVPPAR